VRYFLVLCLILAACGPDTAPPEVSPKMAQADRTSCGSDTDSPFIGQPVDALASATFAAPMRIIWPGLVVPADYSPKRLNFALDKQGGTIVRVYCG